MRSEEKKSFQDLSNPPNGRYGNGDSADYSGSTGKTKKIDRFGDEKTTFRSSVADAGETRRVFNGDKNGGDDTDDEKRRYRLTLKDDHRSDRRHGRGNDDDHDHKKSSSVDDSGDGRRQKKSTRDDGDHFEGERRHKSSKYFAGDDLEPRDGDDDDERKLKRHKSRRPRSRSRSRSRDRETRQKSKKSLPTPVEEKPGINVAKLFSFVADDVAK
jgi:smad nuclear-interacting protein 1